MPPSDPFPAFEAFQKEIFKRTKDEEEVKNKTIQLASLLRNVTGVQLPQRAIAAEIEEAHQTFIRVGGHWDSRQMAYVGRNDIVNFPVVVHPPFQSFSFGPGPEPTSRISFQRTDHDSVSISGIFAQPSTVKVVNIASGSELFRYRFDVSGVFRTGFRLPSGESIRCLVTVGDQNYTSSDMKL